MGSTPKTGATGTGVDQGAAVPRPQPQPVDDVADFAAVDAYVRDQMRKARVPGLVLGLVNDGQVAHLEGYGQADRTQRPFTPQTPFFIGSVAKSFTALAVMQLVEAGRVELDAPVRRYIPWFRVADRDASARITVRHLLNQTSGLTERSGRKNLFDPALTALEPAVRALADVQVARTIGSAAEYSNLNYTILGLLVEMASGQSFEDYLKRHILEPLGMHHTYTSYEAASRDEPASGYRYWFGVPVPFELTVGGTVPTGGIVSTAADMARYLAMYQAGGRLEGSTLLSPEGIAEMLRPAARMARGMETGTGYGMGWFVGPWGGVSEAAFTIGDWAHSHAGMALDSSTGWGVFVMFNVGLHGGAFPGLLAIEQSVLSLLGGGGTRDTGIDRLYLALDTAVVAALGLGGWSLARLLGRREPPRDRLGTPSRGPSAVPLLWEVGVPVAAAVVPPRMFEVGWKELRLYGPDVSYSVMAVAGVFGLTAAVRLAKSVRRRRPEAHRGVSSR